MQTDVDKKCVLLVSVVFLHNFVPPNSHVSSQSFVFIYFLPPRRLLLTMAALPACRVFHSLLWHVEAVVKNQRAVGIERESGGAKWLYKNKHATNCCTAVRAADPIADILLPNFKSTGEGNNLAGPLNNQPGLAANACSRQLFSCGGRNPD